MSGTRYRCNACGNLTRFDVVGTRRTRAFHHYNMGGELTVEEEDVLETTDDLEDDADTISTDIEVDTDTEDPER